MWRRVDESRGRVLYLVPAGFIVAAGILTIALAFGNRSSPLWGQLLVLLFVSGVLAIVWRLVRIGPYSSATAFKIVNPIRTIMVSKEDVARFDLEEVPLPVVRYPVSVGVAVLRNGDRVPIWRLMLPTLPLRTQLDAVNATLESLNRTLAGGEA